MNEKSFDCVDYQRKVREKFFDEADRDVNKLFALLRKKIEESEYVKSFKEKNRKIN